MPTATQSVLMQSQHIGGISFARAHYLYNSKRYGTVTRVHICYASGVRNASCIYSSVYVKLIALHYMLAVLFIRALGLGRMGLPTNQPTPPPPPTYRNATVVRQPDPIVTAGCRTFRAVQFLVFVVFLLQLTTDFRIEKLHIRFVGVWILYTRKTK